MVSNLGRHRGSGDSGGSATAAVCRTPAPGVTTAATIGGSNVPSSELPPAAERISDSGGARHGLPGHTPSPLGRSVVTALEAKMDRARPFYPSLRQPFFGPFSSTCVELLAKRLHELHGTSIYANRDDEAEQHGETAMPVVDCHCKVRSHLSMEDAHLEFSWNRDSIFLSFRRTLLLH